MCVVTVMKNRLCHAVYTWHLNFNVSSRVKTVKFNSESRNLSQQSRTHVNSLTDEIVNWADQLNLSDKYGNKLVVPLTDYQVH